MIQKQTVYLPVKVEDVKPKLKDGYDYIVKDETGNIHQHYWSEGEFYAPKGKKVIEVIQPQKCFVFTPEQLNEYTANVIKQSLKTAAEKADITYTIEKTFDFTEVDKQSITNTFDETFKKFEV